MIYSLTASPRLRRTMHMWDYIYTVNQIFGWPDRYVQTATAALPQHHCWFTFLLYNLDEHLCPVGGRTTVRVRQVKMLLSDCLTCCRALLPCRRTNFVAARSLRYPSFSGCTGNTCVFLCVGCRQNFDCLYFRHIKRCGLQLCFRHVERMYYTKFAPSHVLRLSFGVGYALHRCWCLRICEWLSHTRKVLRIMTVDNMTFLYKYFITAIAYCSLVRTTLYIQTGAGHIYEVNCAILTKSKPKLIKKKTLLICPITIPPQWEVFCRNRRNLIAKTPKRTGEDMVPTTPYLFLYIMGKLPPWLGDHGRIWTRSLDFSVRDPKTEKSNRHAPQRTSPSNMFPQKIQIPGLYHARSSTDMFPLIMHTCLLYTSRCV